MPALPKAARVKTKAHPKKMIPKIECFVSGFKPSCHRCFSCLFFFLLIYLLVQNISVNYSKQTKKSLRFLSLRLFTYFLFKLKKVPFIISPDNPATIQIYDNNLILKQKRYLTELTQFSSSFSSSFVSQRAYSLLLSFRAFSTKICQV